MEKSLNIKLFKLEVVSNKRLSEEWCGINWENKHNLGGITAAVMVYDLV